MSGGSTTEAERFKVFISYAREDLEFADQLADALTASGFDPLVDRSRITGDEEFKSRLGMLILECDTVAFVVSSESVDPQSFCQWEIGEADRYSKRIVPILYKPLADAVVPARLASLDYIFFYSDPHVSRSGFGNGLARLVIALNSDLDWLRQHSAMSQRASAWVRRGRDQDSLLRGALMAEAEKWQANRPANAPEITDAQREYLEASRQAEEEGVKAARQRLDEIQKVQQAREKALKEAEAAQKEEAAALSRAAAEQKARARAQRRAAWLIVAVALLMSATAAGVLWQVHATAQREARVFTRVGEAAFSNGYCDRTLRLAVAGLPPPGATILSPVSPDLEAALSRYSAACPLKTVLALDHLKIADSAWSRDGRRVATVSTDRVTRIWRVDDGSVEAVSKPMPSALSRVSYSLDGKTLLVEGADAVAILDSASLRRIATMNDADGPIHSASLSADGRKVLGVSKSGKTAIVLDARTGGQLARMTGHTDAIRAARFSPDGLTVLTAAGDKTERLWAASSGEQLRIVNTAYLFEDAVFSPDGSQFATNELLQVRVFDTASGRLVNSMRSSGDLLNPLFSPDGHKLTFDTLKSEAVTWDFTSKNPGSESSKSREANNINFVGHTNFIITLQFSPDGSKLLTSSSDGTARIWDARSGKALQIFRGHSGALLKAAWSPDGRLVMTGGVDGQVRVWRAHNPVEVESYFINRDDRLVAYSNDRRFVAFVDEERRLRIPDSVTLKDYFDTSAMSIYKNVIRLSSSTGSQKVAWVDNHYKLSVFDLYSKSLTNTIQIVQGDEKVAEYDFGGIYLNDNGSLVAAAIGPTIRVFDVATGRLVASLEGHQGKVNVVAFSSDGKRVVSGSDDKSARLWDLTTGTEIAILLGHHHYVTGAAFTPDQNTVVTTSFYVNETMLWDARNGKKIKEYNGYDHNDFRGSFSRSGRLLAIGSNEGTIQLIDLTTTRVLNVFKAHDNSVNSVVFSQGDQWIASSSNDGTARVWDVATGEQLERVDGLDEQFKVDFLASDSRIMVSNAFSGSRIRVFELTPTITMLSDIERRNYVCEVSLKGAQAFSSDEMQDIILRGRPDLQNPCRRWGPLSTTYYVQAGQKALGWIEAEADALRSLR
jgi:WD40 repeat protein